MSEPMTNIEIEDVLSSIRRLVSEDFRGPVPGQPRIPDKLVLTPALRVVSDNDDADTAEVDDARSIITTEAAAAVVETALSSAEEEWEPDGSEAQSPDWTVQWNRERDRMARLHLRPAEGMTIRDPEVEPVPADEPPETSRVAWSTEPPDDRDRVMLGEDDLREMVREIIREELQGELGARITRSVRKLVRAEISQALALHDLR